MEEKQKFEDAFKDAFKGAEINPSEGVWTDIELELERKQNGEMRRRLFFYKMLAAASIAFAMTVAGIGYYTMTKGVNNTHQLAGIDPTTPAAQDADRNSSSIDPSSSTDSGLQEQALQENQLSNPSTETLRSRTLSPSASAVDPENSERAGTSGNLKTTTGSRDAVNKSNTAIENSIASNNDNNQPKNTDGQNVNSADKSGQKPTIDSEKYGVNVAHVTGAVGEQEQESTYALFADRALPTLSNPRTIALTFPPETTTQADPVALMFARLAEHEQELAKQGEKEEKEMTKEKLWTAVGFAAGGFNNVNTSVSQTPSNAALFASSSSNSVASEQAKASGVAYSVGVSMGTQISKRWVLQGGVNYLTQMSDYTATQAVGSYDLQSFKAASLNELDKLSAADARQDSKIVPTAPYSVNNSVQFVSVPLQAGYLVINKKLGLQLNAGVSTDLFIQNTINPEGGRLDKTTQGRGSDSPYRSVNFSGLVGTELSYKFGRRYRVALNPGLRYPLNSIYKSDLGIEATPLTFDVGLRFRYILR